MSKVAAFAKPPPPNTKLLLFTFSWTGGNPTAWRDITSILAKSYIHVCPLQLPGRDVVVVQKPVTNWNDMTKEVVDVITPLLQSSIPYAIAGHSFGGWIAYEVIREIASRGNLKLPVRIFVSSKEGPDVPVKIKASKLPEGAFWQLMVGYGLDAKFVEYPEFKQTFYPLFHNDQAFQEVHEPATEPLPVTVPYTVITPTDDIIPIEYIQRWKNFAGGEYVEKPVTGKHMYILDPIGRYKFCDIVKEDLAAFLK
jgi:medium-chain acyl-[acyl-carrier-protein] hydrolase